MIKNFEQFIKESSEYQNSELFSTFEDVSIQSTKEATTDPGIIDDIKKTAKKVKDKISKVFSSEDSKSKEQPKKVEPVKEKPGLKDYLAAISFKESSNDPTKINSLGYMGKYQFSNESLNDILKVKPNETIENYTKRVETYMPKGFGSIKNFYEKSKKINKSLSDSDVKFFRTKFRSKKLKFWPEDKQDKAMIQLLKNNFDYLENYLGGINKYKDTLKKGIKLTIPGMLAGAHLVGPKAVKDFITMGTIKKDGNGTPITEYIKNFGDYKFYLP